MPIKTSARSLSAVLTGSALLLALSLLPSVAFADEPEVPSANPQVPLVGDVVNTDETPTDPIVPLVSDVVNPDEPPAKPPVVKPVVVVGDENNNVFVGPTPNKPGHGDFGFHWRPTPNLNLTGEHELGGDFYSYGFNFHSHYVDAGAGGGRGTGFGGDLNLHFGNGGHWTVGANAGGGHYGGKLGYNTAF